MFRSIRLSVVPAMISAMCPAITRILQESHRKMLPLPAAFFCCLLPQHSPPSRWIPGWTRNGNWSATATACRFLSAITHPLSDTLQLARRYKLSAYDASYLELALRKGMPLATLDEDLHKAAKKVGVKKFA